MDDSCEEEGEEEGVGVEEGGAGGGGEEEVGVGTRVRELLGPL